MSASEDSSAYEPASKSSAFERYDRFFKLHDETVSLVVGIGEEQKNFDVHKGLLESKSSFFRAAFSGNFAEAKSKRMELPEDDTESVALFIMWLYKTDDLSNLPSPRRLATVYSFAEKIDCLEFKNFLVHRTYLLVATTLRHFSTDTRVLALMKKIMFPSLARLWVVSRPQSAMRRLVIDTFTEIAPEYYDDEIVPRELLVEVLKYTWKPCGSSVVLRVDKEGLHQYYDDDERSKKRKEAAE